MLSMVRSWKTTLAGIVAAVLILLGEAQSVLDDKPETKINWEAVATAAAVLGIGLFARDSNVSSEQSGGGK